MNTLIVRIYGLYKLKIYQDKEKIDTIYFISMENIFKDVSSGNANKVWNGKEAQPQQNTISGSSSNFNISSMKIKVKETYDLKGSLYGRNGEEGK